jgi:hypothetical protein
MDTVALKEIERQYRVLRQTLSMHAMFRDRFAWRAKAVEVLLLACSVIFCATTFASDGLYRTFHLAPNLGRIVPDITSVIALMLSLALLVLDWKGQSALHRQATERWSEVLAKFRKNRSDDGSWPEDIRSELCSAYWEAARNLVEIPERRFNGLKARYLRKVAISELKSLYPGRPALLLSVILWSRDTVNAVREIYASRAKQ